MQKKIVSKWMFWVGLALTLVAGVVLFVSAYIEWLHGHDLVLFCDRLPEQIEIKIDFTNGQKPIWKDRGTGQKSYGIQLDENGSASINTTAPFDNYHRTLIQLPDTPTLMPHFDFHLERRPTFRPKKKTVGPYGAGVQYTGLVDGTIYRWKVGPGQAPADARRPSSPSEGMEVLRKWPW